MSKTQRLLLARNVEPIVEDLPPLLEEHVGVPGIYVGVISTDPDEGFVGADVLVSSDEGDNFDSVQSFRAETVAAHAVGTLGGGVSGRFWDTKNTLTVQLMRTEDELSSEDEESVFSGRKNVLLVGREIIGFVNATPTANPREYELTKLARGRRNTEEFIDNHSANEMVVLLTVPSALQFVSLSASKVTPELGRTDNLLFRATQGGLPATDSTYEKVVAYEAKTLQQFAPTVLPAVRDADANATIKWIPRSTRPIRLLAPVKPERLECCECEQYEVEILTADRATVLRRFTILNRTSFVYTAARQTTDFGTPQLNIEVNIFKHADIVGRGKTNGGTV